MRVLNASGTSQKAIAVQQSMSIRGFATTKLKNTSSIASSSSKVIQKKSKTLDDSDDITTARYESKENILPKSKKIQKLKTMGLPFRVADTEEEPSDAPKTTRMMLRSSKVFLEDGTKLTRNYTTIDYTNPRTKEHYVFPCFPDFDLGICNGYSLKLKNHTCDNDCSTDEEQVNTAIKTLFDSLKEELNEENKTSRKKAKY